MQLHWNLRTDFFFSAKEAIGILIEIALICRSLSGVLPC